MIPTHLPFQLVDIRVLEKRWGGIAIAVNGVVAGLVEMQCFRVRARLAFASITGAQMLLMAVSYGTIALAPNYSLTLLGSLLTGLGQGLMLPNAMTWMQSIAPSAMRRRGCGECRWAVGSGLLSRYGDTHAECRVIEHQICAV